MKTARKVLILTLCAALLVSASVMGTIAYLTSTDEVTNTFTVGDVQIKLDEAKVTEDGKPVEGAARVQANEYHLLPGHTYTKDPMVTVLKGSEESYIRMFATVSKSVELDAIFAPTGADLISIFKGYDASNWILVKTTRNETDNTITYEFRYKATVSALDAAVELDPLFDEIVVPGAVNNTQLATLEGMTITVVAEAIQADGFANADAAWAAFSAE